MKTSEKIAIAVAVVALLISAVSLYYTHQEASISREKYEKIDKWLILTLEEFVERGNNYLEEGNYWEAIRHYDKALEIEPDDPNVLRDKGYALINLGIDNESVKVTSYVDAKKFINYSFYSYKNQPATTSQYYFERALECFSKAKALNPEDPETILFYYGALGFYLPTGPDPIESFNETINVIENLSPYKKEKRPVKFIRRCAWYGMGMAHREQGQEEKAEECFRKVNETLKNKLSDGQNSMAASQPYIRLGTSDAHGKVDKIGLQLLLLKLNL